MPTAAQLPSLKVRRAMIEQNRDRFRAEAFAAELDIDVIGVQVHGVTQGERVKTLKELNNKVANCTASAVKLDAMLQEIDAQIAAEQAASPEPPPAD